MVGVAGAMGAINPQANLHGLVHGHVRAHVPALVQPRGGGCHGRGRTGLGIGGGWERWGRGGTRFPSTLLVPTPPTAHGRQSGRRPAGPGLPLAPRPLPRPPSGPASPRWSCWRGPRWSRPTPRTAWSRTTASPTATPCTAGAWRGWWRASGRGARRRGRRRGGGARCCAARCCAARRGAAGLVWRCWALAAPPRATSPAKPWQASAADSSRQATAANGPCQSRRPAPPPKPSPQEPQRRAAASLRALRPEGPPHLGQPRGAGVPPGTHPATGHGGGGVRGWLGAWPQPSWGSQPAKPACAGSRPTRRRAKLGRASFGSP